MSVDITTLFVCIDDFCKLYEKTIAEKAIKNPAMRNRKGYLSLSEMMLIEIYFHFSPYKNLALLP